jgi:nitroreductase
MKVYEAAIKRRSIRAFKQREISKHLLRKLVNAARLSPSASNLQPLEYIIINKPKLLKQVFSCLYWAGHDKWQPKEEEMPQAYIIILANKKINPKYKHDSGIVAGTISLVAFEVGLGSCILGAINRNKLKKSLKIPNKYEIDLIVALGYPAQKSHVEKYKGSTKYWLDIRKNWHVPKRKLSKILHINEFQK